MAREWHYTTGDHQVGPITDGHLRGLVRDGVLPGTTLVWSDGMPEWAIASSALATFLPDDLRDAEPQFFPVSLLKLTLMSFATFGIYEIYWAYKNWGYIKRAYGRRISPFWRAWFVVFFTYDLLKTVKQRASAGGRQATWSPGWLSVAYIAPVFLINLLPDDFGVLTVLTVFALWPVVHTINEMNVGRVEYSLMNTRLTAWNIIGLVVGGLVWALLIYSFFLPPAI